MESPHNSQKQMCVCACVCVCVCVCVCSLMLHQQNHLEKVFLAKYYENQYFLRIKCIYESSGIN